jgi:hypothetical protein
MAKQKVAVKKSSISLIERAKVEMENDFEANGFSVLNASDMEKQMRANEKAIAELEAKHGNIPAGVYDGTNLSELIEEERATLPENELAFSDDKAMLLGCFGICGIRNTAKAITLKLPCGTMYRIGGENLTTNPDVLPPTIKLDGTIRLDRFGKTAGMAFISANGKKKVYTLRATKNIWLGKVVPMGTTAEGVDLT